MVKEADQLRTLPRKVDQSEKSSESAAQPLMGGEATSTQGFVTSQITSVTGGQSSSGVDKNLESKEVGDNSQNEEYISCSSRHSGTSDTFDFESFKLHGSHETPASKMDSSKVETADANETSNNEPSTSANREHDMEVDESYFGIQSTAPSIAASSNISTTGIENTAKKDVDPTQDATPSNQYACQFSNQDPSTENSAISSPMLTLSTDRDSVSTSETLVSSQFEPSAFRRGKHVAGSSGEMSADDDFCYRDLRTRNDSSVSADSFRTARQYSLSEGVFTDESASTSVVGSYERQRTVRLRAESESKAKDSNAEMSSETVRLDGGTSTSQPESFLEVKANDGRKQLPSNQEQKADEFATSAGSSSEERFTNDDDYMCVGAAPDSTYDPDSIASQPLPAIPEDEILSPETICSPELRRRGYGWLSDEEDDEAKAEHMRSFAEKFSAFVASVRGSDDSSTSVLPLQLHQGDGTQPEAKEALASPSRQSTSSISSYLELEKAVFESSQVDDAEAISHVSSDYALVSNDDDSYRCDTNFESESFATTTSFTDDLSDRVGFTDSFDLDDLDSRSVVSDIDKKKTSRIPIIARRRSQSSTDQPKDEMKSASLRESHIISTSQSRLRKPSRVAAVRKDREGYKKSKDEMRQRSSQAGSSSTSKLRKVTSRSSLPASSTPKSTTASKKVKIRKNNEEKPDRQKLRKVSIKKRQESSIVTSPRCASPLSRSSSANSLKSGKPRSIKSGSSSPTTQDLAAMRAEAFKNQASGGRKYIALKEGVYTYKMSLQEEKESRSKLSPLGTGVLSDSGGSSRSGYDNQSRARQDNVSAVLGGGSFLAKGLGLGDGDSCTTVSTSPGNKLVSKIPRKILLKHVEDQTNPSSVGGGDVKKDGSKDVAVHATSFSKIRPPAIRRKSPNEPKVEKRQVEAESATNKDELRASGETISPRYRKVARNVGIQWPRLARALNVNPEHVRKIQMEIDSSDVEAQSTAMFGTWLASNSDNQKDLDEVLLKAFESIDRTELNKYLAEDENIFEERGGQIDSHDVSAFHALEAELGSSPYPLASHVSSPYPYTPNDELRINTSSADATKAEEENETLNSARDSIYEDADYDDDKPHFIYIQEDESMSSLPNGEKDYEEKEEKEQDENSNVNDDRSSDSSCASVCSEVDNYQRNRDTTQAEEERKSDNMEDDDDSSDDDAIKNVEGSYRQAEDSSDEDRPPVRSFSFTVQEN